MSDERTEAVAKAIHTCLEALDNGPYDIVEWHRTTDSKRERCRVVARAALAAIKKGEA
jgi:hypothetical protein